MVSPDHNHTIPALSRREFLGLMGMTAASLVAAGCQATPDSNVSVPATSSTPIAQPVVSATPSVAIVQATSYDSAHIQQQVRSLLDALGGLKGVVHTGDRVAIKTNLTGGIGTQPLPGVSAIESYITHPEVVRALGAAVLDAGAKELYIVESVYEDASWTQWGYQDVAKAIGAKLVDLNSTSPYNEYAQVPVGDGSFLYDHFTLNRILQDVDVFMSVPKMKCHATAGITLSMKNLIGLVPARFYRTSDRDNTRTAFHGGDAAPQRIPHIIVDLNRARPINFALIDGVMTAEGGEGPWIGKMQAKTVNVLIGGVNPLATDTVGAAVMGFDASAPSTQEPFNGADNHFALAASKGLGTNKLADIKVLGLAVKDVMTKIESSR
ncbi:MAG TPA: DUF362 domain-containing protein [Anaerolineae bacterium]